MLILLNIFPKGWAASNEFFVLQMLSGFHNRSHQFVNGLHVSVSLLLHGLQVENALVVVEGLAIGLHPCWQISPSIQSMSLLRARAFPNLRYHARWNVTMECVRLQPKNAQDLKNVSTISSAICEQLRTTLL